MGPLLSFKYFLWIEHLKTWDNGTVMNVTQAPKSNVSSGILGISFHEGAKLGEGYYFPNSYTVTFLRLKRESQYKMRVSAANRVGYSDSSPVSTQVTTTKVAEAHVAVRVLYNARIIISNDDSQQTFNRTFRQEWCAQLGIPNNRMHVSHISSGSIVRLLVLTHYVKVNFTVLTTSTSTKKEMSGIIDSLLEQVKTRGSTIHTQGLINRKLDFGYVYLHWDDQKHPIEYIWQLGVSPKPSDILSAGGAITLGIICFVLIPYGLMIWLPFYRAKTDEGMDFSTILYVTALIWYRVFMVYFRHAQKAWKKWSESEAGKKCLSICSRKRKIKPEDIDPMTGLPYGFDPNYFPDGCRRMRWRDMKSP